MEDQFESLEETYAVQNYLVFKTTVLFQEVGVKFMTICVRDLSGMGQKHDPLTVSYVVTGGECYTLYKLLRQRKIYSKE